MKYNLKKFVKPVEEYPLEEVTTQPVESTEPTIPLKKTTTTTVQEVHEPHDIPALKKKKESRHLENLQYVTTACFFMLIGAGIFFGVQKVDEYLHPEYENVAATFDAMGRGDDATVIRKIGKNGNLPLAVGLMRPVAQDNKLASAQEGVKQ